MERHVGHVSGFVRADVHALRRRWRSRSALKARLHKTLITLIEILTLQQRVQYWEGPVVEAPFLWEQNGLFYLFYSANTCASYDPLHIRVDFAHIVGCRLCQTLRRLALECVLLLTLP